jgi:hypothetical protein
MEPVFVSRRGELRSGWRILIYAGLSAVCGFAALSFYSVARDLLRASRPESGGGIVVQYVLLSASVLFAAFLMLRFVDRCPFAALGFAFHGRVWVELGQGVLHGFLMVSIIFLIEWGFGWVSVSRQVQGAWALAGPAGYYVVLLTFAALFEEAAARGYAFQALIQGTGKPVAVGVTSLLFGLGHCANPHATALGVVNTGLAGVWLSAAYLKTRSLWFPISLHTAWNLSLGFVYGFPLSGVPLSQTVVRSSSRGPVWLTGGDYGPEAGGVASAVLLAATFCIWLSAHVRASPRAAALWHKETAAGESLPGAS